MRLRVLSAATMAFAVLVAGCSDDPGVDGVPTEGPEVSQPGNGEQPPANAPKVANPVQNLDKFMKSPCDMLTKAQAAELGYDASIKPEADSGQGPACEWSDDGYGSVAIVLLNNQPLGIAGIYRNKEQTPNLYKYFEPVDVAGYPGVFSDSYDARPQGGCGLSVGVTDTQVISLSDRVDGDPCDLLKRVAEAAVTTMSNG